MLLSSLVRSKHSQGRSARAGMIAVATAASLTSLLWADSARAEFKIRYPNIDYREVEIEHNFSTTSTNAPTATTTSAAPLRSASVSCHSGSSNSKARSNDTPAKQRNGKLRHLRIIFMLTEPGKYWLDFAIFAEFARATKRDDPNTVELGCAVPKGTYELVAYAQFVLGEAARQQGRTDRHGLLCLADARYRLNQYFQPGIEFYGEIEDVNHAGRFNDQQFRVGPMFAGSVSLADVFGKGKIKYEAGYLFRGDSPKPSEARSGPSSRSSSLSRLDEGHAPWAWDASICGSRALAPLGRAKNQGHRFATMALHGARGPLGFLRIQRLGPEHHIVPIAQTDLHLFGRPIDGDMTEELQVEGR
mgnify:CR=1 FL=1